MALQGAVGVARQGMVLVQNLLEDSRDEDQPKMVCVCEANTKHSKEMPDKNLGCADLLLGILTAGLYFVVVLFTRYAAPAAGKWTCEECGN